MQEKRTIAVRAQQLLSGGAATVHGDETMNRNHCRDANREETNTYLAPRTGGVNDAVDRRQSFVQSFVYAGSKTRIRAAPPPVLFTKPIHVRDDDDVEEVALYAMGRNRIRFSRTAGEQR